MFPEKKRRFLITPKVTNLAYVIHFMNIYKNREKKSWINEEMVVKGERLNYIFQAITKVRKDKYL